jgi:hypothetical protein
MNSCPLLKAFYEISRLYKSLEITSYQDVSLVLTPDNINNRSQWYNKVIIPVGIEEVKNVYC